MSFAITSRRIEFFALSVTSRKALHNFATSAVYVRSNLTYEFDATRVYDLRYGKFGRRRRPNCAIPGSNSSAKETKVLCEGKKRIWVRPLLQIRTRQGTYNNLIQGMRLDDRESHFSFLRMSGETFDVLFCLAVFERLRSNIPQGRKLSHCFD